VNGAVNDRLPVDHLTALSPGDNRILAGRRDIVTHEGTVLPDAQRHEGGVWSGGEAVEVVSVIRAVSGFQRITAIFTHPIVQTSFSRFRLYFL